MFAKTCMALVTTGEEEKHKILLNKCSELSWHWPIGETLRAAGLRGGAIFRDVARRAACV